MQQRWRKFISVQNLVVLYLLAARFVPSRETPEAESKKKIRKKSNKPISGQFTICHGPKRRLDQGWQKQVVMQTWIIIYNCCVTVPCVDQMEREMCFKMKRKVTKLYFPIWTP
jgi:hypothetical protein